MFRPISPSPVSSALAIGLKKAKTGTIYLLKHRAERLISVCDFRVDVSNLFLAECKGLRYYFSVWLNNSVVKSPDLFTINQRRCVG